MMGLGSPPLESFCTEICKARQGSGHSDTPAAHRKINADRHADAQEGFRAG